MKKDIAKAIKTVFGDERREFKRRYNKLDRRQRTKLRPALLAAAQDLRDAQRRCVAWRSMGSRTGGKLNQGHETTLGDLLSVPEERE